MTQAYPLRDWDQTGAPLRGALCQELMQVQARTGITILMVLDDLADVLTLGQPVITRLCLPPARARKRQVPHRGTVPAGPPCDAPPGYGCLDDLIQVVSFDGARWILDEIEFKLQDR